MDDAAAIAIRRRSDMDGKLASTAAAVEGSMKVGEPGEDILLSRCEASDGSSFCLSPDTGSWTARCGDTPPHYDDVSTTNGYKLIPVLLPPSNVGRAYGEAPSRLQKLSDMQKLALTAAAAAPRDPPPRRILHLV